jgi:hypothetical protein
MMLSNVANAQEESNGNDPFLGIKAGISYSGINLSGDNPDKLTSQWITGFAGGLFGNIPLGKKILDTTRTSVLPNGWQNCKEFRLQSH